MAGAVERFERSARAAGASGPVRRFSQGTRTASDAARAVRCEIGQIVKSLVFVADGVPFVALTSGGNRADVGRLAALLDAGEVRSATPEEAREATGFAIGGTPPFGHAQRLRVLVDRDLLAFEVLWAAAGAPDAVFPIEPSELVRISGGEISDFRQ